MTISLGTQFPVDADGDLARFAGLTASTGIALYSSAASGIEARHLTNSGGVLTGGTVLPIDANAATTLCICRLTNSSALIGYAYGATHRVRILTVSGTTLIAPAVDITNMTDTGINFAACDASTSTKVIYCYMDSSNDGIARVLSISGTTITENAKFTYENSFAAAHTAVGAFSDEISAIVFFDSNAEILDISGTTITGNTSFFESGMGTGTTGDSHSALAIDPADETQIAIVACTGANTGRIQVFIRSGGSLSAPGTPQILNPVGAAASCVGIAAIDDRAIASAIDPTNGYIYLLEYKISTNGNLDTDTTISVGAGSASTQIGHLPGSFSVIEVWNETTEAILISIPGPVYTLTSMTKPAAIDTAGANIYVALLSDGTPILTKIAADLSADGTTVFNPGSGDQIGVECGRFDSDVVWVAGQFDGTNVIEKSEDGGATFSVVDDATIGGIRSFDMGPDSDNRLLVFDEDNGDILETRDGGTTWTTIASGITPEIYAIGRLGENVQETVFGNQGAANDNVNYSVNSGADLEDLILPVNQDVTGIIVN